MTYISQTSSTITVQTQLTELGKQYLFSVDSDQKRKFNLVKFSFGDSEIDYTLSDELIAGNTLIITSPAKERSLMPSRLLFSGKRPTEKVYTFVVVDEREIPSGKEMILRAVSYIPETNTFFDEDYMWTNLGPVYDVGMKISEDGKYAIVKLGNKYGISNISVKGLLSGSKRTTTLAMTGGAITVITAPAESPIIPDPPTAPLLISPITGETVQDTSTTFVVCGDTNTFFYQLQVSTGVSFDDLYIDVGGFVSTSYTHSNILNQSYYWRSRALDANFQYSDWSTGETFVQLALPDAPDLLYPPTTSIVWGGKPYLDWTDEINAATYKAQLCLNTAFTGTVTSFCGLTDSAYAVITALTGPATYYWRVWSYNSAGESHSFASPTWNFYCPGSAPSIPVLLGPESGTMTGETATTFTWSAATCANTYTFWWSQDPPANPDYDPEDPEFTQEEFALIGGEAALIYRSGVTGTSLTLNSHGYSWGQTIYWRVRAVNIEGTKSKYSSTWTITYVEPAPEAPILIEPLSGTIEI